MSTEKNLKKKLNENLPDTYESFLAKEGILSDEEYLDSLAKISTAERLGDTNFGAKAANLTRLGLDSSGYEDYLLSESLKKSAAGRNASLYSKENSDYKNRSEYARYLSDYEALQEKISESVIASVTENLNFDVEAAYRLAVNSGLSEAYAAETAKSAVSKAKRAAVKKATAYAKEKGLSALKAKNYAKSLGLDGKYLEEVYDTVSYLDTERKQYLESLSTQDYLKYLKEQSKKLSN